MTPDKAKALGAYARDQGAGQAAGQIVAWALEEFVLGAPVPPQVAVALGVFLGDVAYRLKWERLLRSYKGKNDEGSTGTD